MQARWRSGPRSRGVLAAALAVLALASASAAGCAATSASGADPGTTSLPTRVTVAGDSISVGLGGELRTVVSPHIDVKVIGVSGTGLARPDTFDWPARLEKLAREFPPTYLVFSVSSNDAQDLTDGTGKVVVPFSDKARWDAEYSRRLAASFDPFATTGTTVVWVGHVRTADDKVGLINRHIQQLAAAVAATRPFVRVTDLAALLGTGEDKATRCLIADGLHLSVACLDEADAKLRDQLGLAS
jgi:hypothetical protein